MKKFLPLITLFALNTVLVSKAIAVEVPDTVTTGVYITSIHDIDFKQKQYTINLWLWLK